MARFKNSIGGSYTGMMRLRRGRAVTRDRFFRSSDARRNDQLIHLEPCVIAIDRGRRLEDLGAPDRHFGFAGRESLLRSR